MVTMTRILDVSTCDDLGSILKVTAGPNGYLVTMNRISDILTFDDLGSILKVTADLNV